MSDAASSELRSDTQALLDRVELGQAVTVTVAERPVTLMKPLARRDRWLTREEFLRTIAVHQSDPGLTAELREFTRGTAEDPPVV